MTEPLWGVGSMAPYGMMAGASICGKLFSDMVVKPKHHGMRSHGYQTIINHS